MLCFIHCLRAVELVHGFASALHRTCDHSREIRGQRLQRAPHATHVHLPNMVRHETAHADPTLLEQRVHEGFVVFVFAGVGERDEFQRESGAFGLLVQKFGPDRVHGDPAEFPIDGGKEPGNLNVRLPAQGMKHPGAVFAAAPGYQCPFLQGEAVSLEFGEPGAEALHDHLNGHGSHKKGGHPSGNH